MANIDTPLVSVIIPFMNEERFLEETIQSVLQQDYLNWELLLVDDGSTNNSTQIAKTYAAQHPEKIFYLEHSGHANKGVCESRNLGVEKAAGKLIAFLDADDVFLPTKLSRQVAIFNQHPDIGMVAEASDYWYSWNDPTKNDIIIFVGGKNDVVTNPPQLMIDLYPLGNGAAPCPCSLMLTKKAIVNAGGFEPAFHKEFQLYEDQAFLIKVYLREKVFISSQANNLYRQRPESVVKWVYAEGGYHKVRKFFLEWLSLYLQKHHINHPQIDKLLRRAILPYRYPTSFFLFKTLPRKIIKKMKKIIKS